MHGKSDVHERPLKFLTVSLYHPQVMKGGAQYVAKDLHDSALADPTVQPSLLAGIDGNAFPQYTKVGSALTALPDGQDEYLMAGSYFDDFFHVIYDPRRIKAITHFLKGLQPDIVHVHHSIWIGLEFLELVRKTVPNARILYTLHEYIPICYARGQLFRYEDRSLCTNTAPDQCVRCFPHLSPEDFILRRRSFKAAFELVDAFVSPSEYLRARFVEWGMDPDLITVIPNGHMQRRPKDWVPQHSPDLNVFGFFGQYIDAKGIDVLLEAAARVAKTNPVEIRIFGGNKEYASEDYVTKIDAILSDAPENLKVQEVGPYSRDNIFDLMCSVDWVVVPSVWPETFALVVSEAWDARRPVLTSRIGGLTERIEDGKNGFTFVPDSVFSLAQLMETCIGNPDLWTGVSRTITDEISVAEAWERHKDLAQQVMANTAHNLPLRSGTQS